MIRRLNIKFVCITMSIVTVILLCVLAAVLGLTQVSLERESLRTMWQIALNPARPQIPDEEFTGMRLPYFVLEVDKDGQVQGTRGGYYDLSDSDFLQQAVDVVLQLDSQRPAGGLRAAVSAGGHAPDRLHCVCRYIRRGAHPEQPAGKLLSDLRRGVSGLSGAEHPAGPLGGGPGGAGLGTAETVCGGRQP